MNAMHSRILLHIFQFILVFLHFSPFNALRLSFYNNIADTPQETIEFESDSLFYTGELSHIKSFTCTADNTPTDTVTAVTWYDTSGNEVPMGTGASTSLYWTGNAGNKTLHTSNDAGTNLISVANQGNNFTCRVNEGNVQMKYLGIYWVRPILSSPNTIQTDLRGFRIYTKDTPPVISEFTLQRGLFNFDFSKRYKVQSLKGSSSIVFRPDVVTSSRSSIPSIIDNVTFSNTSVCQSIGTSDSDQLYTTISDRAFFNYEPGNIANPRLSNSACIENSTISPLTLTIGDVPPDIRYTCPLVFNGVFIDTGNLNLDTRNSNVTAVSASLNLTENRRRLWVDFSPSFPVSLIHDRDYVCEDSYSTRISFRINVDGNNPLEVFDSISATTGVVDSINYISNAIPDTLYCVSMSSTVEVTWKFDNIANRSQFVSPVQVPSNSSYLPHATTPRIGRSDLFLNATVASETEGYYTCSDGTNEVRVGVFLQTPVAPVVAASGIDTPTNDPINITCVASNSPYPLALYYWTGPNFYSTNLLDTTGFIVGNSGFYTCHGTNVVGAADVTINVAITPPLAALESSNLTVMDFYFEEDSFQLSCIFSYESGFLTSLRIFWTRDAIVIISEPNGVQIQEMSTSTPNTIRTVLSVASAAPANTGKYKCEIVVGSSEPIANTTNIVVEASYQPDSISLQLVSIGSESVQLNWNGTYRNRITPETYVVSYCELPQCNSYTQSPSLTNTSYTITGLKRRFSYSVFVIATNRYGSTNGTREDFRTIFGGNLYFKDNLTISGSIEDVYFANGSIFRGGYVNNAVFQFVCDPNSITDTIEWYTPNGDLIPEGSTTSFYHTINTATGESTLNLGNYVTAENEGRNFTCRINSSGSIQDHYFGVYYILPTTSSYAGDRIYSTGTLPIIQEFVLQRGAFDIDTDDLYGIQSLESSTLNWQFIPSLVQPQPPYNSRFLNNITINSLNICQLGTSHDSSFFSFSNKPFILRTNPTSNADGPRINESSCIENNSTAYVYTIGAGINIGVTCPLFYNASFLDTSDLIQLDYQLNRNHSRRLWVDPSKTFAMVKHDREYVCEDKYGTRASFKARVDANSPIQVFGNDSTITPTDNDTMYIVNEVTLYCLSDSDSSGVVWYSDTNANSTLPRTYAPVSDSVTAQPYVSNPRNGRSDLIVRSDPTSYLEGYYYCEDSMNRLMFYSIFTQQPVAPIAQINSNATTLQIYIGIDSLNITCGYSNSAHPAPLSYWEGTVTNTIYTNQLTATDSGNYTCISSNVVGYTSYKIFLNISTPPSPQAIDPQQPEDLGDIFLTDTFQLSCQFETSLIPSLSIQWYHNSTLNTIFPRTTHISGNTVTSTLNVTSSSVLQAGDYHCVATVGASSTTNSTPISVIINPITLPNAISVMITDSELRNVTISWTPSIQFPSLTETYTLVYQRVGDSSYQTINTLSSTSFTLTGLLFNSQYGVYVNATNRFGTTQGPDTIFSTDQVTRLYFMREGEIVQFASGSIFRGGIHSIIIGGVFQFYCVPDSPDQVITWYAPNGDVIPAGPMPSGLYHTHENNTGESVLYTNNAIVSSNEGNNFTCSFTPSSGPVIDSSFGIYHVGQDNDDVFGVRLYGPGNVIYEFVYQIGTFSVDLTSNYDIECLNPSNLISQWTFKPSLVSNNTRTNTLVTQAQFNPNATCQYISCNPSVQYPVFSDKPFFLQTSVTGAQPNCRPNNHLYEFSLGSSIELYLTCPLIFGSRFLDVSDFSQIQNEFTVDTSRRLFFNTSTRATLATLALERNFVCEDIYGDSVSFNIRILASEAIQLLDSEDSDTPIANGTNLIGVDIPSIIYCITQSNVNSANWLVDANPNRSLNKEPVPVNTDSDIFPYATNPRVGRSNLILSGTIESGSEGLYTCVTNPRITVGIFSQNPITPNATISPGQTMIQVVIGTNTPVLNCGHNNSPHPLPIYFWTGSMSSSTATLDTNLLLESNSGEYTCTASNVVGLSTDTVTITVIPPPPQFKSILSLQDTIYISDDVMLQCEFYTFQNVTSQILIIDWYKDGIIVSEANINPTRNENTITGFLNLLNSQIDVEGDYHCQARIGASQVSVSPNMTLKFSLPPNPIHIRLEITSQAPYLGQDIHLQCEFSTERRFQAMLMIDWYHNNTKLSNTNEIQITAMNVGHYMVESNLNLFNITFIQAGEYRCVGRIVDILSSEQSNSTIYTLNVRTPTTLLPTITEPIVTDQISVIIGVLIGILFIIAAVLIVVLIIIIACRMGYKNKGDYNVEELPYESMPKDKQNKWKRKHSKNKPLITPTASIGINMAAASENPQYYDESDGRLTFRKSDAFQETLLTNISTEGATAEPSNKDSDFEKYNIPLAIFPQKVLEYHLANNAEFDRQYSSLPEVWLHDVSIGSHINNRRKNRFTDIIPYEHSRVKLSLTGEHNSDYINACYIDGYYHRSAYIASQGPMPHTVNDFWRMIWEKNIDHIIALTKIMEAAKRKCEQYWPENETDMCEFDMIQVTLKKCERYTTYDIRMMEVAHAEYPTDVRIVIQFHYTVWPDHGVPIFSSSLISFINHTKEYHIPKRAQPPMLVHCSAGVGRTGTFIVLDYFMEHLKVNDEVNIYKCVAELRENRCLMVQTKEQYIFIHDALLDIICCKDTFIADHEFQAYLDNAMIRSLESMSTPFEDQYELIMKTSRIVDERDIAEASDVTNIMKNRFPNFVPFDSHRVTVIPDQDGDKDYINASFVHSYHRHKGFIAAQGPLEHTIYDFWKMITTMRIQFIIMLSGLSEGGHEMCAKYWPEEGQEMLVQYLVIVCEKEEEFDDYILRKFIVSTQQGGNRQSIQQIQSKKWHYNQMPEINYLMVLYHQFKEIQRGILANEMSPILVHCDNGSTRTGAFIACVNAIQQLELERKVDIFQIVRNLRNSRPYMVPSIEFYILCFKLVAFYIQSYEEKAYVSGHPTIEP